MHRGRGARTARSGGGGPTGCPRASRPAPPRRGPSAPRTWPPRGLLSPRVLRRSPPAPRPPHRVSLSLAPGSAWCAPCGRPRPAIWEVGYAKATPGRPRPRRAEHRGVGGPRVGGRAPACVPRLPQCLQSPAQERASALLAAAGGGPTGRALGPNDHRVGRRRHLRPGRGLLGLGMWISRFSLPSRRPKLDGMPHKLDGELGDGDAWCVPLGTAHARAKTR